VFLVPALALVVAAPAGPDQGCPSPRQINDALAARIPDVVGAAADTPASALRLSVTGAATPGLLRIEITDPSGEPRLQRTLQPSDHGRGSDCAALAETVALIVDRYLHEVGYELPPSPPPPPAPPPELEAAAPAIVSRPERPPPTRDGIRFDVVAGGAWRGASTGSEEEVVGGIGVERGRGLRAGATLTGGVASERAKSLADGTTATLRRFPLHLALYLGIPLGPGQVEPGIGGGLDWLASRVDWAHTLSDVSPSPSADLTIGYRLFLGDHFFVRAGASVALAVPYRFAASPQNGARTGTEEIFVSPRTYIRSALDLGLSFR
jgi:hypothetical protein